MSTLNNLQADLDKIFEVNAEFGTETVNIGGRDVPCAAGALVQSLDPMFIGDPRERSVTILIKATQFSTQYPLPAESDRVTYRNRPYRIVSIQNGLGNLEYELNLSGVMR